MSVFFIRTYRARKGLRDKLMHRRDGSADFSKDRAVADWCRECGGKVAGALWRIAERNGGLHVFGPRTPARQALRVAYFLFNEIG
jgi:hypothetical protein